MSGELDHIEMTSGVSLFTGEPFVQIVVTIDGKPLGRGQLSPAEVRAHALAYLEAAEAAEQDALVFAELTETLKVDKEMAGQFISALRDRRKA